jgi:hypothetical protein
MEVRVLSRSLLEAAVHGAITQKGAVTTVACPNNLRLCDRKSLLSRGHPGETSRQFKSRRLKNLTFSPSGRCKTRCVTRSSLRRGCDDAVECGAPEVRGAIESLKRERAIAATHVLRLISYAALALHAVTNFRG